ncbi:MAG: glycosyltransferase family 1 protein [Anaerolineae bacterium]|nr:glycosyltransferase family 1 protein [Anaerolineae bacterium]
MRLIRLSTNPQLYLKQFYCTHPHLLEESYEIQYQALMADSFGWADVWTKALSKLDYEVWEPVGNAEPMQKAWAKERGIDYGKKTWLWDITTTQVKYFKPDVVFVNDYATYNVDFFTHLREQCPSIRLIVGWCGAPYEDGRVFRAYNLVLSNIPALVTHFQEGGHKSEHMHHAFEPSILRKIDLHRPNTIPFSFIGSIVKRNKYHNKRERLLKALIRETPLKIWTDNTQPSNRDRQLLQLRQALYDLVQVSKTMPGGETILGQMPGFRGYMSLKQRPNYYYLDLDLVSRSQAALYGVAMYQKLRESTVTLNTHIDLSVQFASNMRLFEATGVGSCLLTEAQKNLTELFEPDVEIVTYSSIDEAVEKVRYLNDNKDTRDRIAEAGQQRTLNKHNFDLRAQQFNQLIKRYIQF